MELPLESLNAFRPRTGTPAQWNAAFVRVEDYLRAHRVHNRLQQSQILQRVLVRVRDAGFTLGNVDATVVAQRPRLAGHVAAMRESVAKLLGVPAGRVNVKVTSTDGLGAIGRAEGIAATAVVLVESAPGPGGTGTAL